MTRVMLVTVGTSLFSSATWEPRPDLYPDEAAGGLPKRVREYGNWLRSDSLAEPAKRARDEDVRKELERLLTEENAAEWAQCLPPGLPEGTHDVVGRRFGAELNTLVLLAEDEARRSGTAVSLRELLLRYDRVHVVTEKDQGEGVDAFSRIAAFHLVEHLNWIAGRTVAKRLEIPGISSSEPERLRGGLLELQCRVDKLLLEDWCLGLDLVLTGGYKVYGYLLSPLAFGRDAVRLLYAYEGADELVVLQGSAIRVGPSELLRIHFESLGS